MVSRSLILVLVAASALSACALDPRGGYRPMQQASGGPDSRQNGMSFDQANAQCWELAYSLLGGNAMDSARSTAYNRCMNERGWEDPRMPARPSPTNQPGPR